MEDSHFNSSYFWSPVPTVQGQIENAMFLNKMKEQLGPEKAASFPHSSSHYPTAVLTAVGSQMTAVGAHLHPPHTSQNITVVPVPSTGIMTAGGCGFFCYLQPSLFPVNPKEDGSVPPAVVMPTPSKRGRKKKSMLPPTGLVTSHALPAGSDALILAHLAAGGQHHTSDPYDLSNDEDDHSSKDGNKSYRFGKPHKCPHCSKSFANSSYLAQHIRIHTGAKPYTCSYCQKTFRQLSHLQQHTRIHTGDRPYKCAHPGCEKAFTQLSNLQSHRRQHNKDKPFKCHNCNRGYTDSASLEVHMSTHTVKHAKLYSCGLCNRAYTSETYLMKHMRKHNPDPLTVAAAVAAQQAQGHTPSSGGGGRGRGRGRGGAAAAAAGVPCPFDLHQYKTVSAGEIQYKPVSVADLSAHKDLCLTVSTSAIQVEHMNS
uniref:Zinc finger protein 384 n=1 Tax=Denticeps clupeoides TaxID=299321 RepID=A0AAY4CT95_9TELE